MSGPWRPILGLVLAAAIAGTGVAAAALADDDVEPLAVIAPEFEVRGRGDGRALTPIHRFTAAEAAVPVLATYPAPTSDPAAPHEVMTNPTWEGYPLVLAVLGESFDGEWLHVRLPRRPNGATAWVRKTDVRTWEVPNRIVVQLSTNSLRVYDGDSDRVLFEALVAVGRGNTPTPVGEFYIDIVNPLGGHRVYGWGQLSVAGFSEVFQRFGGGIGQIAIHGWNNDNVMGSAVSNGCVRMRNVDIEQVAALAPLGTPVSIIP